MYHLCSAGARGNKIESIPGLDGHIIDVHVSKNNLLEGEPQINPDHDINVGQAKITINDKHLLSLLGQAGSYVDRYECFPTPPLPLDIEAITGPLFSITISLVLHFLIYAEYGLSFLGIHRFKPLIDAYITTPG